MEETLNNSPKKPRAPYRKHGDRVWDLAREQYLAGKSARQVSEALGMTEYAIRQRILREGWSKRAHAEAVAGEVIAAAQASIEAGLRVLAGSGMTDACEPMDPRAAARAALDEAVRLMRAGQMAAAMEAARAADLLGRAAMRLGEDVAEPEDDGTAFEAVRRKVMGLDPLRLGQGDHMEDGRGGLSEAPTWPKAPSAASRSPSPGGGGCE